MAEFDPFDQAFRRRANSLRRTPSPRAWNRVENRLDRRRGGTTILGIRPWMIAALLLIVAGVTVVSEMNTRANNPLAKRAESVEELSSPYTPDETFTPVEYYKAIPDGKAGRILIVRGSEYRDLTVAPQYRQQS
ncbi:hypothetical protein [Lewinella sp. W8]|uniref:hypothetical protein n=1 Tax=Lewinella sp. W8 TaxID=2528208 RepID=UPI001068D281|nr:hypothetical protein [Lewinella sp. W8]MTB51441.1 hypothetical protein [Lewinella sp. W8]